ncbi:hypothetical protein EV05_0626 [Prochlorococcus sp. MIT 0601]|nr:hypothetical protein EV05_0626 [Prochlorococcus sp. MIT 0601]
MKNDSSIDKKISFLKMFEMQMTELVSNIAISCLRDSGWR